MQTQTRSSFLENSHAKFAFAKLTLRVQRRRRVAFYCFLAVFVFGVLSGISASLASPLSKVFVGMFFCSGVAYTVVLVSIPRLTCPVCSKHLEANFGNYCPECGKLALIKPNHPFFQPTGCTECKKTNFRGPQHFITHFCTHCGVHLDDHGILARREVTDP